MNLNHFLEMVVEKRHENKETHVSLAQLEYWLRKLIDPSYIEVPYRPAPVPQTNTPDMIPGKFYPGVGVYTGEGITARSFLAGQDLEIHPLKEDAAFVADKKLEGVK